MLTCRAFEKTGHDLQREKSPSEDVEDVVAGTPHGHRRRARSWCATSWCACFKTSGNVSIRKPRPPLVPGVEALPSDKRRKISDDEGVNKDLVNQTEQAIREGKVPSEVDEGVVVGRHRGRRHGTMSRCRSSWCACFKSSHGNSSQSRSPSLSTGVKSVQSENQDSVFNDDDDSTSSQRRRSSLSLGIAGSSSIYRQDEISDDESVVNDSANHKVQAIHGEKAPSEVDEGVVVGKHHGRRRRATSGCIANWCLCIKFCNSSSKGLPSKNRANGSLNEGDNIPGKKVEIVPVKDWRKISFDEDDSSSSERRRPPVSRKVEGLPINNRSNTSFDEDDSSSSERRRPPLSRKVEDLLIKNQKDSTNHKVQAIQGEKAPSEVDEGVVVGKHHGRRCRATSGCIVNWCLCIKFCNSSSKGLPSKNRANGSLNEGDNIPGKKVEIVPVKDWRKISFDEDDSSSSERRRPPVSRKVEGLPINNRSITSFDEDDSSSMERRRPPLSRKVEDLPIKNRSITSFDEDDSSSSERRRPPLSPNVKGVPSKNRGNVPKEKSDSKSRGKRHPSISPGVESLPNQKRENVSDKGGSTSSKRRAPPLSPKVEGESSENRDNDCENEDYSPLSERRRPALSSRAEGESRENGEHVSDGEDKSNSSERRHPSLSPRAESVPSENQDNVSDDEDESNSSERRHPPLSPRVEGVPSENGDNVSDDEGDISSSERHRPSLSSGEEDVPNKTQDNVSDGGGSNTSKKRHRPSLSRRVEGMPSENGDNASDGEDSITSSERRGQRRPSLSPRVKGEPSKNRDNICDNEGGDKSLVMPQEIPLHRPGALSCKSVAGTISDAPWLIAALLNHSLRCLKTDSTGSLGFSIPSENKDDAVTLEGEPFISLLPFAHDHYHIPRPGCFGKKISIKQLLIWKPKPILKPLTTACHGDKLLAAESVMAFGIVMGYMGDLKTHDPSMRLIKGLQKRLLDKGEDYRDEVFCQVRVVLPVRL